jgi:excisionase family DNA binding protein
VRDAEFLGGLSAIVEINERVALGLSAGEGRISELTTRMQQAAGEIDDLRGLVGDLSEIARSAKRPEWMTTTELAADLRLHPRTVRQWFYDGKIPGYKLSEKGHIRFDRKEVAEHIRRGRTA